MEAGDGCSVSMERTNDEKESSDKERNKPGRMECFKDLFKKCSDLIMSTGSSAQFKKYFQEIRAQNPTAFSTITEQLMDHLRSSMEAEINLMIEQEDLEKFFSALDQIVAESKTEKSQAVWRPSGDPTEDCRDHLMPVKCTYRDRMKAMLEKIEKENKDLEEVVLPKRDSIQESQKQLSDKAQHLKEAADICQELNFNSLQEQTKTLTNTA